MVKKNNTDKTVAIVVAVLAVIVLGWMFVSNSIDGTAPVKVGDKVVCEIEPYIDNATFNEYSRGTGVAVTYYYTIDGSTDPARTLTPGSSGTTFDVGDKLTILSSASGYIDKIDSFTITQCGANKFSNYISEGDAITLSLVDDSGTALTNSASGGAVNITDGGAETNANFDVRIQGARDKSTGQVLLTLEGNDTEIDTMSISAKSAGAKVIEGTGTVYNNLDLFVSEGTAPVAKFAFVVDSVEDTGAYDEYTISVDSETGETLGAGDTTGFLYVNAYAGQYFVDTDGTIKYGWENSDGTLKYEQKATDYDALFS